MTSSTVIAPAPIVLEPIDNAPHYARITFGGLFTWPRSGQVMRAVTVTGLDQLEEDDIRVRCIPQTKTGRDHKGHHGLWFSITSLPEDFRDRLLTAVHRETECDHGVLLADPCYVCNSTVGPMAQVSYCRQPPATDHEHCPEHGCVEYVCCQPTGAPEVHGQAAPLPSPVQRAALMVQTAEDAGGSVHDARDAEQEAVDDPVSRLWAVTDIPEPISQHHYHVLTLRELDRNIARGEVDRLAELLHTARTTGGGDHEDQISGLRDELADAYATLHAIPAVASWAVGPPAEQTAPAANGRGNRLCDCGDYLLGPDQLIRHVGVIQHQPAGQPCLTMTNPSMAAPPAEAEPYSLDGLSAVLTFVPLGDASVKIRDRGELVATWTIPSAQLSTDADLDQLDVALNHLERHTRYVTNSAPRRLGPNRYAVSLRISGR